MANKPKLKNTVLTSEKPTHMLDSPCSGIEPIFGECYTRRMSLPEEQVEGPSLDELMETMNKLKAKEPIDIYQSTVMSYKAYNQIKSVAVETPIGLNTFRGIEILPLACMPEDEALMFKDKKDARQFIDTAEDHGYEKAKEFMKLLINIRNLSNGDDS